MAEQTVESKSAADADDLPHSVARELPPERGQRTIHFFGQVRQIRLEEAVHLVHPPGPRGFAFQEFGLQQLWQASGDGPIPTFHSLRPAAGLDPLRTSHPQCVFSTPDDSNRWRALTPALAILSEVNPEVAAWVRQTRQDGKLHFAHRVKAGKHPDSQLAQYDALGGRLTIASGLFAENDGTIAAVDFFEWTEAASIPFGTGTR